MIAPDDALNLQDINQLSSSDALVVIGLLIDYAADTGDQGVNDRAIEFAEILEARKLEPTDAASLNYFCANAWSNRQRATHQKHGSAWSWTQRNVSTTLIQLFG
jgi:hypothetical protein